MKRAFLAAQALRRGPAPHEHELLSAVYVETAFVAAAFANDLEFSARCLALATREIHNSPNLDRAQAALWWRCGEPEKANQAIAAMLRSSRPFANVNETKQRVADGVHRALADILSEPLDGTANEPALFADCAYPIFYRRRGRRRSERFALFAAFVLQIVAISCGALESTHGWSIGSAAWMGALLCLIAITGYARAQFSALYLDHVIELSWEGVLRRTGAKWLFRPWSEFEGIRGAGDSAPKSPELVVSAMNADRTRTAPATFTRLCYRDYEPVVPGEEIDRALQAYAPQFFETQIAELP
jgi:hypothetical protein